MCDEIESERLDKLHRAFFEHNETLCQTLGQALGYPWFKDDPINFPGATVEHGVCVGITGPSPWPRRRRLGCEGLVRSPGHDCAVASAAVRRRWR
jgi:hypothetical protein